MLTCVVSESNSKLKLNNVYITLTSCIGLLGHSVRGDIQTNGCVTLLENPSTKPLPAVGEEQAVIATLRAFSISQKD